MTDKRRSYPKAFKKDAVALLRKQGKPATEIAGDLGIRVELLSRWKREYADQNRPAFSGSGHLRDPGEAERRALLKRVKDTEFVFVTRQAARLKIFDYIESTYNRFRRHSSLGYFSPEEYFMQFKNQL